ncbi:hypothetical protein [Streptomyces chryseus]|uniref:Gamma-glutamyl-phosphate reductase n=1 Tax=Streptomyces chryseus TaxID=68186 RepID=A0ABQ3DGX4_9ACTN|nr:hypothetical protein [Streptomyces chryseus]GHA94131.1 hypothetical protein GCM10010346_16080 [Streptomyces chryseus]
MTHDLTPGRLEEIQALARQLAAPGDADPAPLLADARTALVELLVDRTALVKANASAAEELAIWTGAL